jgi:hypothetical protein
MRRAPVRRPNDETPAWPPSGSWWTAGHAGVDGIAVLGNSLGRYFQKTVHFTVTPSLSLRQCRSERDLIESHWNSLGRYFQKTVHFMVTPPSLVLRQCRFRRNPIESQSLGRFVRRCAVPLAPIIVL